MQANKAMTMKQMSGMMKPMAMLVSPITPINTGAMAPPTILMMRKDEPRFVSLTPKPLSDYFLKTFVQNLPRCFMFVIFD